MLLGLLLVSSTAQGQINYRFHKNDTVFFQVKETDVENKVATAKVRMVVLSADADNARIEYFTTDFIKDRKMDNDTQAMVAELMEQFQTMFRPIVRYKGGKAIGVENHEEIRAAVPELFEALLNKIAKKGAKMAQAADQLRPLVGMIVPMLQSGINEKSLLSQVDSYVLSDLPQTIGQEVTTKGLSGMEQKTLLQPSATDGEYVLRQTTSGKFGKEELACLC